MANVSTLLSLEHAWFSVRHVCRNVSVGCILVADAGDSMTLPLATSSSCSVRPSMLDIALCPILIGIVGASEGLDYRVLVSCSVYQSAIAI